MSSVCANTDPGTCLRQGIGNRWPLELEVTKKSGRCPRAESRARRQESGRVVPACAADQKAGANKLPGNIESVALLGGRGRSARLSVARKASRQGDSSRGSDVEAVGAIRGSADCSRGRGVGYTGRQGVLLVVDTPAVIPCVLKGAADERVSDTSDSPGRSRGSTKPCSARSSDLHLRCGSRRRYHRAWCPHNQTTTSPRSQCGRRGRQLFARAPRG